MTRLVMVTLGVLMTAPLPAAIDAFEFDNPQQEQRYRALISELRCPKCQNQNIADSNAPLAADLRQKVYGMLQQDQSDTEIINFMTARYGDFVTYRPPLKPLTWPLWFGPLAGVVLVGIGLGLWIRRRGRTVSPVELDPHDQARLNDLLNRYDDKDYNG